VCSTLKRDGTPRQYRYASDQRGEPKQLLADLRELALLGSDFYTDLIIRHSGFEEKVRGVLRAPSVVQIASVKSAKYVFPWGLVYDHEFIDSSANQLCPDFAASLQAGTAEALEGSICFTAGCRQAADENVVCPSGFWGFRHVIEQPLSTSEIGRMDGGPETDTTFEIEVDKGVNALVGVSEQLDGYENHSQNLAEALAGNVQIRSALRLIGDELRRPDLHLVYFYCHGGRRAGKAWLGVGVRRDPEQLYPQYLKTWKISWPTVHPLVFINGCKTVGISPDDMLDFNRILAWCKASGVIGTEITIPESLARHVGERFIPAFRAGNAVGPLIRSLRLGLLALCNPLGLVYTPYCMARLSLR
jgi:hypothetical protein